MLNNSERAEAVKVVCPGCGTSEGLTYIEQVERRSAIADGVVRKDRAVEAAEDGGDIIRCKCGREFAVTPEMQELLTFVVE